MVQLLRAELAAAEKASDRVALSNFVEVMKNYGEIAEAQYKAGTGTHAAVLTFKARRLEAEIQLERARAKSAK